jgi:hypothetical protein
MTSDWRKIHIPIATVAIFSLQACAPTKPPVQDLEAAARALSAARSTGAAGYAADEYRAAGQHYEQAQGAEARQDYDAAAQLAREAAADSELASARTRLAKAREAVRALRQENAGLDRELADHPSPEAQP